MNHRKIAELAHVSTSTVSKALSGSREVSDDVAEMIRRIALETGYFTQKNKRKAENKRRKEANISIVCPEIISIHYSRIVTLVKSFVEERGGRSSRCHLECGDSFAEILLSGRIGKVLWRSP